MIDGAAAEASDFCEKVLTLSLFIKKLCGSRPAPPMRPMRPHCAWSCSNWNSELAEVQRVVPLRNELARIGTMHVMEATFSILTKCIKTSIQTYYCISSWSDICNMVSQTLQSNLVALTCFWVVEATHSLQLQRAAFASEVRSQAVQWYLAKFRRVDEPTRSIVASNWKSKLLEDWLTKMVTKESNHQMLDRWASQLYRSPSRKWNARAERTRPQSAWTSWIKCVTAKLFSDLRTKMCLRLWNF